MEKYETDKLIRVLALAIGTSRESPVPDHYLRYLAMKLVGLDSLNLDLENQNIYMRLVQIIEDLEEVKPDVY
jgi:hypothetical protein